VLIDVPSQGEFKSSHAKKLCPMHISMNDRWKLKTLAVWVVAACAKMPGQSPSQQPPDPALATLGGGFISSTAQVNGTTLHFVRGGMGPAVFSLHGFPEDWYEFHQVMPRLAKQFTVIAGDLRGVGGSAASAGGYDAANMAEDNAGAATTRTAP
jgi:hypothetical protein